MQPLDELIRDVLRGERIYAVQGNDWYGWWAGRLPDGRQVFAAFGGRGVYSSRWQQITHPELADPNAGPPTLHLAIFDAAGALLEIQDRPDTLRIDPKAGAPTVPGPGSGAAELEAYLRGVSNAGARPGIGPEFDVAELEACLAAEFGGFQGATIRVRPFRIDAIGLVLHPLHSGQVDFLDNPDDHDEEERESIRAWIDEGCSELLYGNDYFLDGDGAVSSS